MPLRSDSARVREQMLAAARRRVDAGDLDLPMNAVAKDAGVGVGTVYRHFPSRLALLEALAEASLAEMAAEADRAAAAPDPSAALAGYLRSALLCLRTDPALALVLAASDAACPATLELGGRLLASLDRLLDHAKAEGVIRADVTGGDVRALVCGVQHAADVAGAQHSDRYLAILLQGLKPR